jgi:hypothetical protein
MKYSITSAKENIDHMRAAASLSVKQEAQKKVINKKDRECRVGRRQERTKDEELNINTYPTMQHDLCISYE